MKIRELQGSLSYKTLYCAMNRLGFDNEQIENTINECKKHEKDYQ